LNPQPLPPVESSPPSDGNYSSGAGGEDTNQA
jgi:hypothetical protein